MCIDETELAREGLCRGEGPGRGRGGKGRGVGDEGVDSWVVNVYHLSSYIKDRSLNGY